VGGVKRGRGGEGRGEGEWGWGCIMGEGVR
jgi:hypothetical protein